MRYCFLDHRPAGDAGPPVPDCPDSVAARSLATVETAPWGLYRVEGDPGWAPEHPVGDALAALIESATRYPPALGLARDELPTVFAEHAPTREQFASAYGTALRTHLARQHEAPYVVAAATRDIPGDLVRGQWYWLLGVAGTPAVVSWVSADFTIFQSDLATFDLTGDQLKRLGFAG